MKIRVISILILFITLIGVTASEQIDSAIVDVTVFTDRAQVTREAVFNLQTGEHKLVLTNLPDQIDPNSIQVKGSGNFMLSDVKLTTKYLTQVVSIRIRELVEKRQSLEKEIIKYNDAVNEAESEKRFIENISRKLTATGEGSSEPVLDPGKWIEMVSFYREKIGQLNSELRESRSSAEELRLEVNRINMEIQSEGANQNRAVKEVEISIDVLKEGKGKLDISYLVYGPGWIPDYTVRVDGLEKSVSLMYQALVWQSTGEDWSDVSMKLSTAKPQLSGRIPELVPWFVNAWKPQPVRSSRSSGIAPSMAAAPMSKSMTDELPMEMAVEALPEMAYQTATATAGTTSVLFELSGKNTIISDNQTHKVTVSVFELPGEFQYSTVPKLSSFAYLVADVTNNSDFPFLSGGSHIFLDSNYVSDGYIDSVSPEESFSLSLGIDEGFSVERKLINRFEETSGFFTKKIKITYDYIIEITNNKRTTESIVINDQIPVPQIEDIKVTLIKPEYSANTSVLEKDENEFLKWSYTIKPGKTIKIPFSYSIEYPEKMVISGLE
ncbi:MAG: mucoidy inhibitor MuiA family protein [Spirochaetales bacterium]|nr:mucoidy inhibitor MuiA family protein [Spirochaetales bacterium]